MKTTPPMDEEPLEVEFPADPMDMWSELEGWQRAMENSRPNSKMLAQIRAALKHDDGQRLDVERMRRFRQSFMRLSADERRDYLNGWAPDGSEPDRGAVNKWIANYLNWSPQRVLTVLPEIPGSRFGTMHQFETIPSDGGTEPVIVHIAEGTTLEEVKIRLAELNRFIEAHWPQLIRGGDLALTEREKKEAAKVAIAAEVHGKARKASKRRGKKSAA